MKESPSTILLHNIGDKKNRNYNTREEVERANGLLTFDGIYKNVWENRDVLKGKKFILFIMGNYVGKDNSFDKKMPLEEISDWQEIMELVAMGGLLGWHTWSHADLTKLSYDEIIKEISPPIPMELFAYPYGRFNDIVVKAVKDVGYKYAFSVNRGDNSPYQKIRKYL